MECSEERVDELWLSAWRELEVISELDGSEFSMSDVVRLFHKGLSCADVTEDSQRDLIAAYLEAWTSSISPVAGLEACLREIGESHVLSVVSNTHDSDLVPSLIEKFKIEDYFESVTTSIDVGWRKPHPEIFRISLEAVNARAEETLFVGDAWIPDVVGPQSVGMGTIYIGSPPVNSRFVSLSVSEFAELPGLIHSISR